MKQISKSPILFLILALVLLHCKGSEANHHHRHRHNRHTHGHSHVTGSEEESSRDRQETLEENEEQIFVAAWKSPDESDENNSMSNSVESRTSSPFDGYGTHLCIEDEEDLERGIRHLGVKCTCPKIKAPVCGSDGFTYYNRCFLVCRARQALLTYHRYRITLRKFGPC